LIDHDPDTGVSAVQVPRRRAARGAL